MSEEQNLSENISVIAKPLATGKLHERALKLVKKATKEKCVKRGVKEVVKAIRKKSTGLVIMAGDISPIDVLSHVPVMCEDANIPYIFVPNKSELGAAGSTRRPTCCVLIQTPKEDSETAKLFEKCLKEIKEISA